MDGVYVKDGPGRAPTFHAAPTLTDIEVARVHPDARQRIEPVLCARGLLRDPDHEPAPVKGAEESLFPSLQRLPRSRESRVVRTRGAVLRGLLLAARPIEPTAVGVDRQSLALPRGALKTESGDYSLHAAKDLPADKRDALEHLLRYLARRQFCQGWLMLRDDCKVIWHLRNPWRDGTRAFVFDPLGQEELWLERLVALIPHPREH